MTVVLPGWVEPVVPAVWAFDRRGRGGSGSSEGAASGDVALGHDERVDKGYFCARCGHLITTEQSRTTADGQHIHRFVNPHDIAFLIGCFKEAPVVVQKVLRSRRSHGFLGMPGRSSNAGSVPGTWGGSTLRKVACFLVWC